MNLPTTPLMVFGFAGQALFSARFIVQWLASEAKKKSVIPLAFWYFSLAGGIFLLIYATLRHDPVFILGQAAGLVVYVRNLVLIYRHRGEARQEA
jgi:lipid-A-disaccharide synthase-like uncharacterized protein